MSAGEAGRPLRPGHPLRLGSRRSPMAVAQSRQVADMITARTGRVVEIVGVTTLGDVSRAQLTQIGGTGVFVSALRDALLGGEVDLAVHSLKDLPTGPAAGIVLAAVPPRDDPRDVLVARDGAKLADLTAGARIGTGPLPVPVGRALHVGHTRVHRDQRVGDPAGGVVVAVNTQSSAGGVGYCADGVTELVRHHAAVGVAEGHQ
jgi:hydroxymethylbilane synthase